MKKDGKMEVIAVSAEEIKAYADRIALDNIFAASTLVDSIKVDVQGKAGASGITEPDGSDLDEWCVTECEKSAPQATNEIDEEVLSYASMKVNYFQVK